jgi:hypothetical protein
MTKDNDKTDETLNRFKDMTPVQKVEIIEGVVDAVLSNLADIEAGKKAADKAVSGQLAALSDALKTYAEPMTEDVWEKVFRANVADRLDKAEVDGSKRYQNRASRDVMVNLLKVATMGLTLAKQDRAFAPSYQAQSNLKKYAAEVRPMLQKAIDPATAKPRLRSIAKPPQVPKKLPYDTYYWLIGCENADDGIEGANTVIGGAYTLVQAEREAKRYSKKYESFLYCVAKMEPLGLETKEEVGELPIQNAAVSASTISSTDNFSAELSAYLDNPNPA